MRRKILVKKTLRLIISLLFFTVILYALLHLSTGDPALSVLRKLGVQSVSPSILIEERIKLGIEGNFFQQYVHWLLQLVKGNLGRSFMTDQPVQQLLAEKFSISLCLIGTTFLLMCPVSLVVGGWIGNKESVHWLNQLLSIVLSFPIYWLAIVVIFLFGVQLHWFPFIGSKSIQNYLLPIFVLCLSEGAYLTKMVSELIMPVAASERQRIARYRGIKSYYRFYYQLSELTAPLTSLYGNSLLHLFGGSVMVEIIFSMSGVGKLLMDAIATRDYPVIQGITLVVAFGTFILSYLIDVTIQCLDTRVLIH